MSNQAAQELQAYVRRIESVEDEINALNADKSEIYKEAKSNGFTPKTLRKVVAKRRIGAAERDEQDTEFDLYWNAVHGIDPDLVRAHVENIDEFDADGVEIATQPAPAAQMRKDEAAPVADAQRLTSPAGAEGIVDRQPIQPETANQVQSPEDFTSDANIGGDHENAAHPEPVNLDRRPGPTAPEVGQNGSEHQRAELIETNKAPAGRAADESPATNITPIRHPKPFRPNCLNRDKCGGQGPVECWQCTKAAAANRGATA